MVEGNPSTSVILFIISGIVKIYLFVLFGLFY